MSDTTTSPLPSFLRLMISSVARHAITGIGTVLVAHGLFVTSTQQSEFQDLALAAVLWGAGLWWSGMQKKATIDPQPAAAEEPPH